ncbi:Rrf2 family transcriptional regulator [Enterococcus hermanniensis]|nr:Rrf2 family transcriptional regulator [Enterococcus hermanniensis]
MKYSIQFSDAIHILTYIEIFKDTNYLSSEMIASSVETNAANVRKIMSNLKKSHLILTQTGKAKPTLAKSPTEITLLDVYQSIEGNTNLIQVDPKTNPDCIVGANIQDVLTSTYTRLQASVEAEMSQISLQQIIEQIAESEKRPENAVFVKPYLS